MPRQHPRISQKLTVWYRLPWSREWQSAEASDISVGGLGLQSRGLLWWSGLPLDVELQLPQSGFRARARVTHTKFRNGMRRIGLRFEAVPRYAWEELRALSCSRGESAA